MSHGITPTDTKLPNLGETVRLTPPDPAVLGGRVLRLHERYPRISDDYFREKALSKFQNHLTEIAMDPSGSDPADYLPPEAVEQLRELKEKADNHVIRHEKVEEGKVKVYVEKKPWPGAIPITHEETTLHWLRLRRKKRDPIVRDEKGKPIVGYRRGFLSVGQFESPVMFCSDGNLRLLIKPGGGHKRHQKGNRGKHNSRGKRTFSGYCRMPDPELAYPVLDEGEPFPVSYKRTQSYTFETEVKNFYGIELDTKVA